MVTALVVLIFFVVYARMILGGLPFLQLDRTGIAPLGAIAPVTIGELPLTPLTVVSAAGWLRLRGAA